jgi:hypothetical protein
MMAGHPRSYFVVLLLVALGVAAPAQMEKVPDRIYPADDGPKDPSFVTFRGRLLQAARARNVARVRSMTVAQPKAYDTLADEEPGNLREFNRYWKLPAAPNHFFVQLIDVLEHGGRFVAPDRFIAPYWYTDFRGPDTDWHSHIVVIREAAPVFAKPDEGSQVIARVSYDVLQAGGGVTWFIVTLPDGRRGQMRTADARHPSGAHAYFKKINGVWKLAIFTESMD